ncbi:hypothetical protein ALC60_02526 [Trachymyrmex zeteki]|uniref:Uncharacterized protein n=1 Tax=Mycetomoellerius zeteki TaxID=64791 RepID=A0A151XE10_9HYME|nr:hypothetical protein ALC60_02526 [Trachymyrmex zeteki]
MHKEAGTPPGQATPRGPAAKRWGYRASAGRGIRHERKTDRAGSFGRILQEKKSLPVRAHLVGDGLGDRCVSLYGLLAEHAVRILDAATTSSTAVVPSATSRLTTHPSVFRRDSEKEEEEAEEEEEEKEEDPQERVQRRSFQPTRSKPSRRRTTTVSSTECESDEECGELISTESEGCHGESRPDRVVLISRRILSRGLC